MSWALSLSCGLQSSRIKQACGVFLTSVTSRQVWGVDLWHYGGGVGIGVALGEEGDVRLEVGVTLGEEVVSFLDLLSLLLRKGRPLSIWSSPWWRRDVLFELVVCHSWRRREVLLGVVLVEEVATPSSAAAGTWRNWSTLILELLTSQFRPVDGEDVSDN